MLNCVTGGCGCQNWSEQYDIKIDNTAEGVNFHVSPKDKSKTESFKKFVEACNDWCNDACC